MSNKITYECDCNNISVREAVINSINSVFDKYGSNWFEEAEKEQNIIEIKLHKDSSVFYIIVQDKKNSGIY